MFFIELGKNGQALGRFNLPDEIPGGSAVYKLHFAGPGGKSGVIFHASKASAGRPDEACAVKLLRMQEPTRIDRFDNEIRVLRSLSSPHIVKYHDDGLVAVQSQADASTQDLRWLAMELGGTNVRQFVEDRGPLGIHSLKAATTDICTAASHLHAKGFVHRDINPDNLVSRRGSQSLLLTGFGMAKRIGEDSSTRPMDRFSQVQEFAGPVSFSSPELIKYAADKKHPVDHRSDIFQIGKVLWFLATGTVTAGIPSKKDCPAQGRLRDIVIQLVDEDPDNRIQRVVMIPRLVNDI